MDTLLQFLEIFFIPFLLLSLFVLVTLLLAKRSLFYAYNKKKHFVKQNTNAFLTSLIFETKSGALIDEKVIEFKNSIPIHRSWCKKVVINEMISFKKNLRGETNDLVIKLYKKLELQYYSAQLIKNWRYYQKCEGFYHFQYIDYKPGKKLVKPYLKHKNRIIRSNAYTCYLSLVEGKLEHLFTIPNDISLLNIIKLMELLHIKKIKMPKNIKEWLQAENDSVKRLGIKTMVFFNYREDEETIISLLKSGNHIIRNEAIIACRELYFENSETALISDYFHDTYSNKKELLRSLTVIGANKSVDFLKQVILYETDSKLKLLAVNALNTIDAEEMIKISLENDDALRMLKHVNDIYIV